MTYEFASKLLNPNTHHETMVELKYYAGFNREEPLRSLSEACLLACDVLKKQEKVKKNTKQLKELIADINLNEISSQIQADNLSAWLHIITKEMNKLVEELE